MTSFLSILSAIMGYIYTIAWSASFWFMSYEVWRLKSAEGKHKPQTLE